MVGATSSESFLVKGHLSGNNVQIIMITVLSRGSIIVRFELNAHFGHGT